MMKSGRHGPYCVSISTSDFIEGEPHGVELASHDSECLPQRTERLALGVGFHRNRAVHGGNRLHVTMEAGEGRGALLAARHADEEEEGRAYLVPAPKKYNGLTLKVES